jgi:predicted nucleotidyltransferase
MSESGLRSLEQLKVSAQVRRHLEEFAEQLIRFYGQDLVSIAVFGSAASGDFSEATSDVNLLVVYSDLNIADLNAVAKLARTWLKKARFMPRFLSLRNLTGSARYFQVDFLDMRDAHVTIFGTDVLDKLELRPADLHWQLAHEVKRMRMRLKQQFWRAAGDEGLMRDILAHRFNSLLHLMRPLLMLQQETPAPGAAQIVEAAVKGLGIDQEFANRMLALKAGKIKPRGEELTAAFTKLMDTVRLMDEHIDSLTF